MPLGPYADWDECIRAANQMDDVDDAEAYCGALERDEGTTMTHVALLAPEGVQTSDRRLIQAGALSWRDDLPLMFIDRTTAGHDDAVHVGNASNVRRETVNGETWIVADVEYDSDEQAREAMRLADEDKISGVSVDLAGVTSEIEILDVDDERFPTDWVETVTEAEIIGFTQLPMPAFSGAKIESQMLTAAAFQEATLTAAANPQAKAEWFDDPKLPGPTPLTVTDDGRVYGHLATWGTCHTGFDGVCIEPPASETEYAYFNLGAVKVDDQEVPCGHITLGTGHASLSADSTAAARHYDDTGTVVADIRAGEDEHGVWVAGAARPGADLDVLRSASLSGDWRRVNGNLELVAALAVNVPGFPVPRIAASAHADEQLSLVASGVVERKSDQNLLVDALRHLSAKIDGLHDALTENHTVDVEPPEEQAEEVLQAEQGRIAKLLDG